MHRGTPARFFCTVCGKQVGNWEDEAGQRRRIERSRGSGSRQSFIGPGPLAMCHCWNNSAQGGRRNDEG